MSDLSESNARKTPGGGWGGDRGEMRGGYRGGTGEVWGRYGGDMGEMWGRCGGDMGEIWGRYGGDVDGVPCELQRARCARGTFVHDA